MSNNEQLMTLVYFPDSHLAIEPRAAVLEPTHYISCVCSDLF